MTDYIIGIDVGGTNTRIAMGYENGHIENFYKTASPKLFSGGDAIGALEKLIQNYLSENAPGTSPKAVVIGFPSTVDSARGVVLQTPNLPGLSDLPVSRLLGERLQVPVIAERDVNLLFWCDVNDLSLSKDGITVGIYVGTGIGNAIFFNGTPLPGKNGVVGELGHIPTIKSDRICSCGNIGCSECYASGRYLSILCQEHFPHTPMEELFVRHKDTPELKEFIDALACTIAAEVNLLDPEYIVLGGGVVSMESFPYEELLSRIKFYARKPYPAESLTFYRSKDAVENGVRGAVAWGYEKLK